MEYKRIQKNGIAVEIDDGIVALAEIFSFLGGSTFPTEGINGICKLFDESGYYNGTNLEVKALEETTDGFEVVLASKNTEYTSIFSFLGDGVWKRSDKIKNIKAGKNKISSCLSRFILSGGNFDVLTQEGAWCSENETELKPLNGNITLSNNGIRTTQDAQPFIALKEKNQGYSLCFHLLPVGQWKINLSKRYSGQTAMAVLDMGLFDEGLSLVLEENEEIELPEIVFFRAEPDDLGYGSRKIQKYLLSAKKDKKQMPLLYNTWFLDFENLNPDHLKNQADMAKRLGLEYFVVDSGWFGFESSNWYNQCGNYVENEKVNFKGNMRAFADYIRSLGMKFGLWFEIERVTKDSPFYKENPELFIDIDSSNALYNFALPEARQKVFNIIKKHVDNYGIEFIKFDYNAALAYDPTGSSFYRYYSGWYQLMDKFRKELPQVFFECCSSGGLRTDSSSLLHYDSLFSSDTVHPFLTSRLIDGAMLRVPPRFITKWLALREVADVARRYYKNEDTDLRLLSGTDGAWEITLELPADFLEAYSVINGLGFTGQIDDYSDKTAEKLSKMIDFYKELRPFVEKATSAPLTPIKKHTNYHDDIVWQLSATDEDCHVIVALHLENYRHGMKLVPKKLCADALYEVSFIGSMKTNGFDKAYTVKGSELSENGFIFAFPDIYSGRIAQIKRVD